MAIIQDPATGLIHNTDDPFQGEQLPWQSEYLPQFNAAQIDLNALPQLPHGYDPSMLAMARARSDEGAAAGGTQQMSQMRRVLGQAGLTNSPAAAAYQGQIANMVGNQQAAGRRDIDISNMQMANQMALESAKMLFSGMSQNAGFQQQGREAEYGTKVGNQRSNFEAGQNAKMQANALEFGSPVIQPGAGRPQVSQTGATIAGALGGNSVGDIAQGQQQGFGSN